MAKDPSENACDTRCPVQRTARIIESKWTTLIIRDLIPGKRRYSQLLRSLDGISPRILAARLKFLQDEGLVKKTIYPVIPPQTEYELTETGHGLCAVIAEMAKFGEILNRAT